MTLFARYEFAWKTLGVTFANKQQKQKRKKLMASV